MKLEQIQQAIPQTGWINWPVAITGLASFLTTWVPIFVGILSGIWIGLQLWMFLFVNKPWKKRRKE
ncbi:MAG TPA: hypothetical protein VFU31_24625 [Candidatus Binatia bacterium]|nr:hypothetical protein [Candidatus Binatia bacterium]